MKDNTRMLLSVCHEAKSYISNAACLFMILQNELENIRQQSEEIDCFLEARLSVLSDAFKIYSVSHETTYKNLMFAIESTEKEDTENEIAKKAVFISKHLKGEVK
ncbi:hypothetical protein FAI40_03080 [Acetobacteraceae bacterium]|nr:hypothetical protein FAI40_03080 [Acetobacteraceae bacterium]